MEPKASMTYRVLKDIQEHPVDILRSRSARTSISIAFVHRIILYLEERKQIIFDDKKTIRMTEKGKISLKALETLHRMVRS